MRKWFSQTYDDIWSFVAPEGKEARWAYGVLIAVIAIVVARYF